MAVDTIVVGIDSSEGTAAAVRFTAELAAQLGAVVVAVHAYEPLDHLEHVAPGTDFAEIKKSIEGRAVSEWCHPLQQAGVEFGIRVADGSPFQVLMDAAEDSAADLIVVGARRMGWLKQLALGSTSSSLIREARRPVTVVHPDH